MSILKFPTNAMLLDKIFLIFLSSVLSLLTCVTSEPLFDALAFYTKGNIGGIAAASMIFLILISAVSVFIHPANTVQELRRFHFLSWGILMCSVGLANFIFAKSSSSSSSTVLLLGVIYLSNYVILKKREIKDNATPSIAT